MESDPRRAGVPPDGTGRQGLYRAKLAGRTSSAADRALVGAATGLFPEYGLTKGFFLTQFILLVSCAPLFILARCIFMKKSR